MAALQKIRNKGVLLVSVIALALFLFVAGDLFRGLESLFQNSSQQVGEVNGKSISIQDYQKLVDDFQTYMEITQNKSSFNEDELNQIKDQAWNSYVQSQLIEDECEKLGIGVTDNEIAEVIKTGASQLLQVPVFMNQQTGTYDYSSVSLFLSEYNKLKAAGSQIPEGYEKIYKFYLFAQKQIKTQLLTQKYQTLLANSFLSNPLEAKLNYDSRAEESDLLIAAIPAASVKDDAVSVSDEDIKAKYNEDKEKYVQYVDTRDIKYIQVTVLPSEADKKATEKEFAEIADKLASAANNTAAGNVVRQANSVLPYSDVYKTKDAFSSLQVIASKLDSAAVGSVSKPAYDPMYNIYYTYKVLDKKVEADSVLFRQIGVVGKDEADIAKKADSIMTAINTGAAFKDIAKKYNQAGDSTWIATAQFQNAQLDADNALYIKTLYGMSAGETKKLKLENGNTLILQVMKTANPVSKYNVAAVVKALKFSDETYNNEYNKFSSFVAANTTLEAVEANAPKQGYSVTPLEIATMNAHNIAGIHNTRDALKWAFDEAKIGEVSPLYECGDNNTLLLVALTGINEKGYRSIDKVKDDIKQELMNTKKVEKIYESVKGIKDIATAKSAKDAVVDTVKHVSFAAPSFISATTSQEPLVSAYAAKTAKGAFSGAIKGNNGVYMFQVINKTKTSEKYDTKSEQTSCAGANLQSVGQSIFQVLQINANVKDNRYKFF